MNYHQILFAFILFFFFYFFNYFNFCCLFKYTEDSDFQHKLIPLKFMQRNKINHKISIFSRNSYFVKYKIFNHQHSSFQHSEFNMHFRICLNILNCGKNHRWFTAFNFGKKTCDREFRILRFGISFDSKIDDFHPLCFP